MTTDKALDVKVGDTISAATRDHGHLAAPRVKRFSGLVEATGSATMGDGEQYTWVSVRLYPNYKAIRWFDTRQDSVTVTGRAPAVEPGTGTCECGCGGSPKGKNSRFLPGHDAKAASAAKKAK